MEDKNNRNKIYTTIGASNHVLEEREQNDFYATSPIAIDVLLNDGGVTLNHNLWECACGVGHLSEKLKEYGYHVFSTDLIDRAYGTSGIDFLRCNEHWDGDIITNPPYKYAKEFIYKAMELISEGNRVFMFLKLTFLEGKGRKELFEKYPPKCVYVSRSRIPCAKNGNFEGLKASGGSAVAYAWYEFEKGYSGETVIKWIN